MPRSGARARIPRGRTVLALGILASFVAGSTPPLAAGAAKAEEVFEVRDLRVEGRPILAFPIRLGEAGPGQDLGVLAVRGGPPDEEREVALFSTRRGGAGAPAGTVPLPKDVVAIDVADVDPAPGDELVLVSARALRIVPTAKGAPPRTIALLPPLPLPPRVHDVSLLGASADWSGAGEPQILLPTAEGVRLVGLRSGAATSLEAPVVGEYEALDRTTTTRDNFFYAQLAWPSFTLGRDDGDARRDLFSLSRYGIEVFRAGPSGLPTQPSRSMTQRPFTTEEELRPRASQIQQQARDLDGDGLTDLVQHRTFGTLLRSEDRTEIFRNEGNGADIQATPSARVAPRAGVGILDAVDLDGDGRLEIVQARIGFGVVQLLRVLTTRRAQVELRVDRVDPPGISGLSRAWSDTISVGLDFEQGRLEGLFPTVEGDWNGDGRRDLLLGLSGEEIGILLGVAGPDGPAFAANTITQKTPATGRALVADLDGDGLDDLTVHDPRDAKGNVHWLRNRGGLPGGSPALHATPDAPQPAGKP
jgi:hypothetical protein